MLTDWKDRMPVLQYYLTFTGHQRRSFFKKQHGVQKDTEEEHSYLHQREGE